MCSPRPRSLLPAFVVAMLLPAGSVWAQGTIVSDLAAAPEMADDAAAVSLLVRSMLGGPKLVLVDRDKLAGALIDLGLRSQDGLLPVEPAQVERVMDKTGADRVFVGVLTGDGKKLQVTGKLVGPSGATIVEVSAAGVSGELAQLARRIARKLAPRIGASLVSIPSVSLGQLRPFLLAAVRLAVGDREGAFARLRVADPAVGRRLPLARDSVRSLWSDAADPLARRLDAALAAGNSETAIALADEGIAANAADVVAHAGKARALLLTGDTAAAGQELDRAGRAQPAAAVARAELVLALGRPAERARVLAPLLADPALAPMALAIASRAPAGAFTPGTEAALVRTAGRLAAGEPGLVSAVAWRAVRGRIELAAALPLLRPADFTLAELLVLRPVVQERAASGDDAAVALAAAIKEREELSAAINLRKRRSSGPRSPLAEAIYPFVAPLKQFATGSRKPESVQLIALEDGGQPFFWPVIAKPGQLRHGLEEALGGAPLDLDIAERPASSESWTENTATATRLLATAEDADLIVLYRLAVSGKSLAVTVLLFDVESKKLVNTSSTIPIWRTGIELGLVRVNLVPVGAATIILASFLLLFLLEVSRRLRGSVVVHINWDPGAKNEIFSILLTRSRDKGPTVANAAEFAAKTKREGPIKTRTGATMVEAQTVFRKISPGLWYVYLYGVYTRAGELRALEEGLSVEIDVRRGQTTFANFDLVPNYAELHIDVSDGPVAVAGAFCWVDDARKKAVATRKDGKAVVFVPRGRHTVRVQAGELLMTRPLEVLKTGPRELKINLAWERRMDDASRALEQSAPEEGIVEMPFAPFKK